MSQLLQNVRVLCLVTIVALLLSACTSDVGYALVADYGGTAMTVLLMGLTAVVARYLVPLLKSKDLREKMLAVWSAVTAAVREVNQTYVDALREGRADGKLTDEEKAEAKRRAIAVAKSNIGIKGLRAIAKALGLDSIDDWLASKVEAVIGDDKAAAKLKAAANPK